MKIACDPSDVANNHYKIILLLNKPTESHTEEEVTIESACPSTLEQATSLDNADGVIDLADDSEMTTSHQSDSLQNNTSSNELQFPTHLLSQPQNVLMTCHIILTDANYTKLNVPHKTGLRKTRI